MVKAKTKKTKTDASEWYSLQDIVTGRMFPWATSFWSVRNIVALDQRTKNILQPLITGTGRGTKYHFKGENISNFLKAIEAGEVRL